MRTFVAPFAVAAGLVAALMPGLAAAQDVRGRDCVDIVGSGNYQPTTTAGTYELSVSLLPQAVPACRNVTYTLYVFDAATEPLVFTQQGNAQFVRLQIQDNDDFICIGATTGTGGHTFDTAPDAFDPTTGAGCLTVQAGGPVGGGQGFQ